MAETLLDYLTTWLEEVGWRPQFGPWLYSVLTRLEKPLTPDVSSRLRDLALLCSNLRRDMAAQGEVRPWVGAGPVYRSFLRLDRRGVRGVRGVRGSSRVWGRSTSLQ